MGGLAGPAAGCRRHPVIIAPLDPRYRSLEKTMRTMLAAALAATALAAALPAHAQTTVANAWVRATSAPQQPAGGYLTLTSARGGKLVAVSSPAGMTEMHEMAMDGTVMRMRQVTAIDLPAGKPVELKPGGLHLMLMGLKAPLKAGETVSFTLVVEGRDGQRETLAVKAPVKPAGVMP
jgi:copper(I)-binding protein